MPGRNKKVPGGSERLSVSFRPQVAGLIGKVAEEDGQSLSSVVADLVEAGLVLREQINNGYKIKLVKGGEEEQLIFGLPSLRGIKTE